RGDLLHRPPQRGRVQIRAVCLDQLQLLRSAIRSRPTSPRKKNRSNSGLVGSSANFPYASA
ncbi:hypothetical protein, partial [Streptomyces mutomycini]|uniref:hypothetical protein n=1 Tax=Streptomyces mutomycini TaxID=284036 RepID=UPI001ABFEDEC